VPRIQPVELESAPEASRPLMEKGEQGAGKMLNFYKEFAVSPAAFEGYMNLNATLSGGAPGRQDAGVHSRRRLGLQRLRLLTGRPRWPGRPARIG
jgi:hypothetical protein